MKRRTGLIVLFIIISVSAAAALWLRDPGSPPGREAGGLKSRAVKSMIKTAAARNMDFPVIRKCFGIVESKVSVKVVARSPGRVVSIEAVDERPVKKGDLLFTLGGPEMDSLITALRQKVKSLEKRVALAEENAVMKKKALKEKLVKRAEYAASKDALYRLKSELHGAVRESAFLKGASRVAAPIDGVFTGRRFSAGQYVEKGVTLAEVIVPKKVRVAASVFPPPDTTVVGRTAYIAARDGVKVKGRVTKLLTRRTPGGAAVVWIEGGALDNSLRPGESVNGEILVSVHRGSAAVPEGAVVRDEDEKAYLFIRRPGGYIKKPVGTGLVSDGWVEITSGIKEGDTVVVQGAYELFYRDFSKTYKVMD